MIIILIIIGFILFFPIPIIIDVNYEDNKFLFFINKIKINKSELINEENVDDKIRKAKRNFNFNRFKNILSSLNKNKIKPTISYRLDLDFGLDDAALTGFSYGLVWCVYPLLNYLITAAFNIKKCEVKVTPHFNEKLLKLNLHSIIITSLAKTLYIFIYIFIRLKIN